MRTQEIWHLLPRSMKFLASGHRSNLVSAFPQSFLSAMKKTVRWQPLPQQRTRGRAYRRTKVIVVDDGSTDGTYPRLIGAADIAGRTRFAGTWLCDVNVKGMMDIDCLVNLSIGKTRCIKHIDSKAGMIIGDVKKGLDNTLGYFERTLTEG